VLQWSTGVARGAKSVGTPPRQKYQANSFGLQILVHHTVVTCILQQLYSTIGHFQSLKNSKIVPYSLEHPISEDDTRLRPTSAALQTKSWLRHCKKVKSGSLALKCHVTTPWLLERSPMHVRSCPIYHDSQLLASCQHGPLRQCCSRKVLVT